MTAALLDGQLAQQVHDDPGALGIEGGGGLVCQDDAGTIGERPRNRNTLRLAPRQQVSLIDPVLPLTTIIGRYVVLAELLQATLRRYRVFAHTGLVAGAYCPGTYDLAVADWKIAGMSQHWFRNRCGTRCVVTAASINVEEAPDEVARVVNRFYRCAGRTLHCDAGALTNVQLCGGTPSVCGPDFPAAVIDQLASSMSGIAASAPSYPAPQL